jgi:GNAT superfamily N-acetyltransferase
MELRRVDGADDRAICADIFVRSYNGLREARGDAPLERGDVEWMPASLEHLGATDPEGLLLALDDGAPVAFGCAYRRDRFWFLSYLFVLPGSQASGTGRALLEALLPPAAERSTMQLATVVESSQPVSTMLYARYGIVPRAPLYWLKELARLDELPHLPDGLRAEPLSLTQHRDVIDRLDRELLGYVRPRDHELWSRDAKRSRVYLGDDGSCVGYGYLAPDEWVCPAAAVDEAVAAGIIRDVLAGYPGNVANVTIQITGSAGSLLPLLLRAGMRCEEGAQLLYCSNGRVPPPGYLLYAGFLP